MIADKRVDSQVSFKGYGVSKLMKIPGSFYRELFTSYGLWIWHLIYHLMVLIQSQSLTNSYPTRVQQSSNPFLLYTYHHHQNLSNIDSTSYDPSSSGDEHDRVNLLFLRRNIGDTQTRHYSDNVPSLSKLMQIITSSLALQETKEANCIRIT